MNRSIKRKKSGKLNFKKGFTKDEMLFIKQYPLLHPICFKEGIKRLEIKKCFKKCRKTFKGLGISNKEIEVLLRRIIFKYK